MTDQRLHVLVEPETKDALRDMAHAERVSVAEIVRRALEVYRPLRAYRRTET